MTTTIRRALSDGKSYPLHSDFPGWTWARRAENPAPGYGLRSP
jgi:hypothetical protein